LTDIPRPVPDPATVTLIAWSLEINGSMEARPDGGIKYYAQEQDATQAAHSLRELGSRVRLFQTEVTCGALDPEQRNKAPNCA
jgi:hypothetical protein